MTHTALATDEPEPHDVGTFTPSWTPAGPEWQGYPVGRYVRTGTTVQFSIRFELGREPIRTTAWVDQPKAIEA